MMPVLVARRPLITAALAVGATLLIATPAIAAPNPGDSRATAHDGNVTDCAQAGLPGQTIQSLGTKDQTDRFVTITAADVPSGKAIVAVVVKGGPAYNVYQGLAAWTSLHSPVNGGGQIPQISHWFACVEQHYPPTTTTKPTYTTTTAPATTTTQTTTETTTTTENTTTGETTTAGQTTTPGATTTTNGETTTTTTAAHAGATTTNTTGRTNGQLPNTGFGNTWLVWVGALSLLAGAGLLLVRKLAGRH